VGQLIQADFSLSTVQREIFLGSLNLFAMFGAISSNYFSDHYGRRQTFIVAAIAFIIGISIEALAPNYSVIMFGRSFVGLGVGVGMAVSFVHLGTFAPLFCSNLTLCYPISCLRSIQCTFQKLHRQSTVDIW
jgi:predicted MFS family arabinose efflux permease